MVNKSQHIRMYRQKYYSKNQRQEHEAAWKCRFRFCRKRQRLPAKEFININISALFEIAKIVCDLKNNLFFLNPHPRGKKANSSSISNIAGEREREEKECLTGQKEALTSVIKSSSPSSRPGIVVLPCDTKQQSWMLLDNSNISIP